jgi:Flp pilus assembly protein TadD/ketosteroid isomerase-like protein
MPRFPDPRQALVALLAALVAASFGALADDIQDASKLLKSGQPQQALDRVNKVLATKPKDPQARFLKGLIFADQGNTRDATDIFLALTKDYPDLPEPYNNLAVIYASQGQYEKARGSLEQSIRTHPSYATAYENLGDVYAKLASQAYDKALQIDSANPAAKNKLALVRDLVGGTASASTAGKIVVAAAAPTASEPAKPSATSEPVKPSVTVAAVEPARPALEKAAPVKPAAAGTRNADVLDTVNAWVKAWSSRDVNRYLAFYARDFRTPGGESRADWESARRLRISAPKSIAVSVDAPKVSVGADGQSASVTFRQAYRSDVVKAAHTTKTLVLAKVDGRWLIQQERVGN